VVLAFYIYIWSKGDFLMKDFNELYIQAKNQSSCKRDFITEGSTDTATVQEAAICIVYNMKHNKLSYDEAAKQAHISPKALAKITDSMITIAEKVVKQAGDLGPFLDHSGRGSAGVNHYAATLGTSASDVTPKTDFIGDSVHAISLKKSSGKGPGAQLMSAKSGEASGVVQSAIKHYQHNKGNIANEKAMKEVFNILGNEMKKTATNTLNVEVGKGKDNFENWYKKKSPRRDELIAKGHKPKQVEDHLRGELSLHRVTQSSSHAKSWLIKGEKQIGVRPLKVQFQAYIDDEKQKATGAMVSARHLEKLDKADLTDPKLKEQIVGVLSVAMKTQGWQTKLEQFFNDNEDFKKYLVYEASSGIFKFTGKPAGKGNYKGGESAVAKQILVFDDSGIKVYHKDIWKWSKENTQLANKLSIAYKGSGRSKYIKMAIMASKIYDHELPTLMEELDQIDKELLTEGILGNIGKAVSDGVKKAVNALVNFAMRIIDKAIGRLKGLLEQGLDVFLDMVGISVQGGFVNTPSW
jgi:hypothetical protein